MNNVLELLSTLPNDQLLYIYFICIALWIIFGVLFLYVTKGLVETVRHSNPDLFKAIVTSKRTDAVDSLIRDSKLIIREFFRGTTTFSSYIIFLIYIQFILLFIVLALPLAGATIVRL